MSASAQRFTVPPEVIRAEKAKRAQARVRSSLEEWCKLALEPFGEKPERHHQILIHELEDVASGKTDRLMVLMPPGSAKSTYASKLFPAWLFCRHPRATIIAASHTAELAEKFGRNVRNYVGQYSDVLGYGLSPDRKAAGQWETTGGGEYFAAGVGGAITGRRADFALIDDPVKSREEAESPTIREKIWDWYRSDLYTRLKPGAAVVLIQCMAGDTPVLMAEGSEKPLRDILPGDKVASYKDGALVVSTVRKWINNGPDFVYEIKTTSGITVKANERHPFLVSENGKLQWVRLKDLRRGHEIVRASGVSGKGASALKTDAVCPLRFADIAPRTTISGGGPKVFARLPSTLYRVVTRISNIVMGSLRGSLTGYLPVKAESALCVGSPPEKTSARIGAESSASTIAMILERCAGFSVTTAILSLDTRKRRKLPQQQPNTSEFILETVAAISPSGVEDVFDVQIDDTENFIANGLVSHNTRWHEEDLGGKLLAEMENGGDQWRVLKLPALATANDDPLGRPPGAPLWPEWEDAEAIARKRAALGERDFGALFQQDPRPSGTSFFDQNNILSERVLDDGSKAYEPVEPPTPLTAVFAVIDTAIKTGTKHDGTAVTYFGLRKFSKTELFILDWDIVQIEGALLEEWLPNVSRRLEDLAVQYRALGGSLGAWIEDKASGTILLQQAPRRGLDARSIDSKLTAMGKDERAISVSGYVQTKMVKISHDAFNKTMIYKGRSGNHFLMQVFRFQIGVKDQADDLLDTFTYGISLALGDSKGF